jgi:hypothetical protein
LKVGPISAGSNAKMNALSYIYNSGRNFVKKTIPDIPQIMLWLDELINGQLKDMMADLLGEVNP